MPISTSAVLLKVGAFLLAVEVLAVPDVAGQTKKVEVINTPSVNVANTPTVNVKSLPAVQLASGAAVGVVGTPTVRVANAANDPLPVHDPGTPVRTPVQLTFQITVGDGVSGGNGLYDVPAGKRLVIEYASASGNSLLGDTLTYSIFTSATPPQPFTHFVPAAQVFDFGNRRYFIAGQMMKIFAEPANTVSLRVDRTVPTGQASVFFSISGFLEDTQ